LHIEGCLPALAGTWHKAERCEKKREIRKKMLAIPVAGRPQLFD
jgi:hypothetical protein